MLSAPEGDQTTYERQLLAQVRDHGWRSTHVHGDDSSASFTYSTGFWLTLGHPEILVFDFPAQLAHDVIGTMFRKINAGADFATGQPVSGILAQEKVVLVPVRTTAISEYLISSSWFYRGADFPCLQLVWPDSQGHFPWETGFDSRLRDLQPDLSGNGDTPG